MQRQHFSWQASEGGGSGYLGSANLQQLVPPPPPPQLYQPFYIMNNALMVEQQALPSDSDSEEIAALQRIYYSQFIFNEMSRANQLNAYYNVAPPPPALVSMPLQFYTLPMQNPQQHLVYPPHTGFQGPLGSDLINSVVDLPSDSSSENPAADRGSDRPTSASSSSKDEKTCHSKQIPWQPRRSPFTMSSAQGRTSFRPDMMRVLRIRQVVNQVRRDADDSPPPADYREKRHPLLLRI